MNNIRYYKDNTFYELPTSKMSIQTISLLYYHYCMRYTVELKDKHYSTPLKLTKTIVIVYMPAWYNKMQCTGILKKVSDFSTLQLSMSVCLSIDSS